MNACFALRLNSNASVNHATNERNRNVKLDHLIFNDLGEHHRRTVNNRNDRTGNVGLGQLEEP